MPVVPNGPAGLPIVSDLPMAIIDKRRVADTKVVQGLVVGG